MCPLTKDKEKDKDYSWASNYEKKKTPWLAMEKKNSGEKNFNRYEGIRPKSKLYT